MKLIKSWIIRDFLDKLGEIFWFGTNSGPQIHLIQLISPKYMPVSLIKTCFCCKKSLFFITRCPVGPQLQMGISPGLCGIFQSSWVRWKEHNLYFHWFQAQYVIICGPRAMGQAPEPPPPPLGHLLKIDQLQKLVYSVFGGLLSSNNCF
jgi:hypothetical protein